MKLIGLMAILIIIPLILKAIGLSGDAALYGTLCGGLGYVLAANDGDKS